jgi:hypothetical protein
MAIPDPRWLEILKASGWQTAAVAGACALFLLIAHWGWLPPLEPWMIQLAVIAALICGLLALASFTSATLRFFPVQTWVLHWISRHRAKRAVRDYIPHMTDREKKINSPIKHRSRVVGMMWSRIRGECRGWRCSSVDALNLWEGPNPRPRR